MYYIIYNPPDGRSLPYLKNILHFQCTGTIFIGNECLNRIFLLKVLRFTEHNSSDGAVCAGYFRREVRSNN